MRENLFYDGYFYEAQALIELAKVSPVRLGLRLRDFDKPYREWKELDGVQIIDGREYAIEVKSYPLAAQNIINIVSRYRPEGFKRFKIVAPAFEKMGSTIEDCEVECIGFRPNLEPIRAYYASNCVALTPNLNSELEGGKHHFRYKLAFRARNKPVRFLNQIDKRIKSISDIRSEILRRLPRDNPPVRVYWSTCQWLSPKQLYFSREANYVIGGPLVFDVDGPKIHCHKFPCYVGPSGLCEYCFYSAKVHTMKLVDFLNQKYGLSITETVFSGRQGFHLYVFDWKAKDTMQKELIERTKLLRNVKMAGIDVDELVTADVKHVVSFPSSLHAYTLRPVMPIKNLSSLRPSDLAMERGASLATT